MKDPKRIDHVLKTIREVWKQNPDQRLCQLLGNVFPACHPDIYYLEDDELMRLLKSIYPSQLK